LLLYFSFTSLSTVGFGDFSPRSDFERLITAMVLLLGVAIFSYILGEFSLVLSQYQAVVAEIDDYECLSQFFGTMKHYNKGKNINQNLKEKINAFFAYKWAIDKNQAIDDDLEKALLEQLP